jgi:hypothetical protein
MNPNDVKVLTEKEITQKMAGYKANYNRKVNAATGNERKALEDARDEFIANRENAIRTENQHNKMVRAGYLAWETRRANCQKRRVTDTQTTSAKKSTKKTTCTCKKQNKGSKVGIRIIHK